MYDVFISYASENSRVAQTLANSLVAQGFNVWWDRKIPPGKTWDEVIGNALDTAKCVVVLWSEASVNSRWVREEADRAVRRKCLIPALIEEVQPPFGFERIEAANLVGWQEDISHPEFQLLKHAVADHVRGTTEKVPDQSVPERKAEDKKPVDPDRKNRKTILFISIIIFIGIVIAMVVLFIIPRDPPEEAVDPRLKRLISQIFDQEPERSQKAVDIVLSRWSSNPDLIPPLLKFASLDKNQDNRNGIYHTVAILNGLNLNSLVIHQEKVLTFLDYAKTNGTKTNEVVMQVCNRFTKTSVRHRCIN